MHELSVAMGIVRIAENEIAKVKARKVDRIELEIGSLSGIEIDALDFVWSSAVKDTVLENAFKAITIIKGEAQCETCETHFELDNLYDPCPNCNGYFKSLLKGKELLVKTLEVS